MAAKVHEIVDAVYDRLTVGTFEPTITLHRLHLPIWKPEELTSVQVSIVPSDLALTPQGRERLAQGDYTIDIAVQRRMDADEPSSDEYQAELRSYIALCEAIEEWLRVAKGVFDIPSGRTVYLGTEWTPLYSVEHLNQHNTFTSVLRSRFRMVGV